MFEKYDNCWFEIKSDDKRMMFTRDHMSFERTARTLSRIHNIALYRVENGRRSRIFLSEDDVFRRLRKPSAFSSLGC
ncbi:MAG TPA: hypothetical protein VJI12_00050 [archaeon]|nr:hypothetical protein [archaeon]